MHANILSFSYDYSSTVILLFRNLINLFVNYGFIILLFRWLFLLFLFHITNFNVKRLKIYSMHHLLISEYIEIIIWSNWNSKVGMTSYSCYFILLLADFPVLQCIVKTCSQCGHKQNIQWIIKQSKKQQCTKAQLMGNRPTNKMSTLPASITRIKTSAHQQQK